METITPSKSRRSPAAARGKRKYTYPRAVPREKFFDFSLDLTKWKHLDPEIVKELTWFHAVATEKQMPLNQCEQALGYDANTLYRIFKSGDYGGSFKNVVEAIQRHRKVVESQDRVTTAYFVENTIFKKLDWIFDYTLARRGCSMVVGEAGVGKTACLKEVCKDNNHGTSAFIECLPIGGNGGLLKQIYQAATGSKDVPGHLEMFESSVKALNSYRILVLDEFHLHLPEGRRPAKAIEMVRRLRDLSGCAIMFVVTHRFEQQLAKAQYMFEQFTGRTGKPFYLPKDFIREDVLPIVQQFIASPTDAFMETILAMANDRPAGRLRHVVETFEFASALGHDINKPMSEKLFLTARKVREQKAQQDREEVKG